MEKPETTEPPPDAPRAVTSVWPALLLLAFAIAAFAVARGYSPVAARFPSLVAGTMIVLCLLDLWSRTRLPGAGIIETFGGTSFRRREMMHNPGFADQAQCIGWIAGAFALMAAVGILPAAPVFCALFVRLRGRRPWRLSVAVGLGTLAFLVGVFEWALDYELYRGLLFTKGGVAAW